MNRYCVLAIPRTGSTWLLEGINYTNFRFKDRINLSEFFTHYSLLTSRYELDKNSIIRHINEKNYVRALGRTDFINSRLSILLNGDANQPLVLKYMYWSGNNIEISDLDILAKIQNHNIRIINLNRDPFESAVSFIVAEHTKIWARNIDSTGQYWVINDNNSNIGNKVPFINIDKFKVSDLQFKNLYYDFIKMKKEKQEIADKLNCSNVDYNSLELDCIKNMIPIKISTKSIKIYDTEYSNIIENFDQLLEIKDNVDKMVK
jgi:hypothetical protein